MDYQKIFERFEKQNGFIKETFPAPGKDGAQNAAQKAALNRKGNVLFNSGDIETARRIFLTTGYTDGLCRIGDHYKSQSRPIDALKMYWIAPDHTKAAPIITHLSGLLQCLLHENEEPAHD